MDKPPPPRTSLPVLRRVSAADVSIPMKGCPTAPEHYRAPPSSVSAFSSAAARHPVALCPACAFFGGAASAIPRAIAIVIIVAAVAIAAAVVAAAAALPDNAAAIAIVVAVVAVPEPVFVALLVAKRSCC